MSIRILSLLAAEAPTWLEQVKSIPKQTWINVGICLIAVVVMVRLWRLLKKINDFVPYIAVLLAVFLIFFYWVYERSEPKFLTPVVEKIAPFFPSKGK